MSTIYALEKIVNRYFACYPRKKPKEALDNIHLIAHRGAHNNACKIIENTDKAFTLALEQGCWGIELDIHSTKDGVIVVNHDADLKRLWQQSDKIKDLSFKQLRVLVPEILSLEEVIDKYAKKLHLFIEVKTLIDKHSLSEKLAPLIAEQDYHLLSLKEPWLDSLDNFPKSAQLLVAEHNNVEKFCQLALDKNYGGVLGHYLLLTKHYTHMLTSNQKKVGVGFIDSKYSLYREINRGYRWIFTNQAVKVSQHLQALKRGY